MNRITPWMYGSCIEDVNHEIYGGLYAQRIFGESFEEPPNDEPLVDWKRYGGEWTVESDSLSVRADAGAKLVRNAPDIRDGAVACDIRFADANGDNAGLIVRVANPRVGADRWSGYEISLSIRNQSVVFGRHRENWELLRTVPTAIKPDIWYTLRAEMQGKTLRVWVGDDSNPVLEYTDTAEPLEHGSVGIRTWNSNASFRNFRVLAPETLTDLTVGMKPGRKDGVSGMWDWSATGNGQGFGRWNDNNAFNTTHSQEIVCTAGDANAAIGIANRGLNRWGIPVRKGQTLTGHLYLKSSSPQDVTVAMQSADGSRTYTEQKLLPAGTEWSRRDFTLRSNADDPRARFAILLNAPGSVSVDQVYLSGTGKALFRGLPMRADIGEKLVEQGLTFLRYGGTMVNAPEYRWKQMIGERDKRPQYRGHWYPQSTNGFGIEDFVQFCEKAKFEPAFAINIEEAPEDAADLVEYLNGAVTTVWGAKRATNGHPKPYNVKYIQIGNEEGLDGNPAWYMRYLERFKLLEPAMHARDPKLNLVIAAWWRPDEAWCKRIAQELNGKAALWDVHVGGDNLRDADDVDRELTRMQQLFAKWIPDSSMKAAIFEENGNRHDLQRALGHARILNVTQRHGDFVLMDCPANCLQPLGQNDNGWNQGQVFFLPDQVWGMPPYYAQQMAARNHLPLRVASEIQSPQGELDVTATRSEDGSVLVLKVVNSGDNPHTSGIMLKGFSPRKSADVWTLAGNLTDVNTPENPDRIRSVASQITVADAEWIYVFPPRSYTVIRLTRQ